MIVPYMSIDLLFAASFFLCREKSELTALGRRIMLATVIAAACFLAFPLRYAFETPATSGWPGAMISWFKSADRPYNLAPSLHIAFRSILWTVYVRHTRSLLRAGVKIWFVLIGLSTLLVFQHHIIDVLAGQLLAMLCIYLIPEIRSTQPRSAVRNDAALWFCLAAAACVLAGALLGGWGWLMLWPAFSFATVAGAYATGSVDLFRKRAGRLAHSALVIHWPYLAIHWLSWRLQSIGKTASAELAPGVWIGRRPGPRDILNLRNRRIIATLDLTAELSEARALRNESYFNIPILDLTLPDVETLERAIQIVQRESKRHGIYIHCALGYGRTAVVAAAFLLANGRAKDVPNAIAQVRSVRSGCVFSKQGIALLKQFQNRLA
jgi:membrane-associated phospholipid phosphatase